MDSLLVLSLDGHEADANGPTPGQPLRAAIDVLRSTADVQVLPVTMPGDLDGALHRRGGRTLVVAGGDQGLHTVVSALHRRNELDETVLAMLPLESGSQFARGAGIPSAPADSAHVVLAGAQRRFDLIEDCRGDIVVNGASVVRNHRVLAGLRQLSGVEALSDLTDQPLHVQVVADDQVVADFDRPVLGVAVNNCPAEDGGRMQCPDADPCDGFADVVVAFASGGLSRVRDALRTGARRGQHQVGRADVLRLRARRVSVAGQWYTLATDGRDTGAEQRCTWTVLPERLRMIVPG